MGQEYGRKTSVRLSEMTADRAGQHGLEPFRTDALALVLPTFHEAVNIAEIIRRIVAVLDAQTFPYELIVVDDASADGTAAIVRNMCCEFPQLRLLERTMVRGLSGAILDGWASSSASVLAVIDADLQHPPELLPQLWSCIEHGADLCVASRYAHGATTGRWLALRRSFSWLAILLCRPLLRRGSSLDDPMSGFFMVRRSAMPDLSAFQRSGFKLLLEILVRAPIHTTMEVPFCFGLRQGGQSKANFSVFRDYVVLLGRLYVVRFRELVSTPSQRAEGAVERASIRHVETQQLEP